MKLIRRKDWKARSPKDPLQHLAGTRGVKVHYTGAAEVKRTHSQCAGRIRAIQNDHMDANGWDDIGYSFLVCMHGYVFEGRGLHHLPAANGPGLNSGHYAVCALVGNKGVTVPSADMLNAIVDAIHYCRTSGGAGLEVKGHRDGYSTDCPGPQLYPWVKKGAPRPGATNWTEDLVKELPTLGKGDRGEHVETVQGLLIARSHPEVQITGTYDAPTIDAVKAVQKWGGVTEDGITGEQTWPVLLRVH